MPRSRDSFAGVPIPERIPFWHRVRRLFKKRSTRAWTAAVVVFLTVFTAWPFFLTALLFGWNQGRGIPGEPAAVFAILTVITLCAPGVIGLLMWIDRADD